MKCRELKKVLEGCDVRCYEIRDRQTESLKTGDIIIQGDDTQFEVFACCRKVKLSNETRWAVCQLLLQKDTLRKTLSSIRILLLHMF